VQPQPDTNYNRLPVAPTNNTIYPQQDNPLASLQAECLHRQRPGDDPNKRTDQHRTGNHWDSLAKSLRVLRYYSAKGNSNNNNNDDERFPKRLSRRAPTNSDKRFRQAIPTTDSTITDTNGNR